MNEAHEDGILDEIRNFFVKNPVQDGSSDHKNVSSDNTTNENPAKTDHLANDT